MFLLRNRGLFAPGIVQSGLRVNLDAGNPASYPGSGTTWTDLTGTRNATLQGGAGFTSADGGAITFNGTSHWASIGSLNRLANASQEVWFRTSSTSTSGAVRQYLYTQQRNPPTQTSFTYQQRQGIHIGGDGPRAQYFPSSSLAGPTVISPNVWYLVTAVFRSSGGCSLYLNGVEDATNATNAQATTVNQGRIARRNDGQGDDWFGGRIAIIREYDRALTPGEVAQNFNALRGRFGV